MPRLIWTPAALNDVQRLYRSLNVRNPQAARDAVAAIRTGVRSLARYPESGRAFDAEDPALRERVIAYGRDGFVALYRHEGDWVHLLAVRHGREAGY